MPKEYIPTITFKLYKGSVTIDFYEQYGHYKHVYIVRETGNWPISVTKATGMVDKSGPLGLWQERLSREFLQRALKEKVPFTDTLILEATTQYRIRKEEGATTGGLVHDWIDKFLQGTKPPMPKEEKVLNGVTGFLEWFNKNDVKVEFNEQIVYSKKYDYVGKLDVIIKARIPGKGNTKHRILFDYKTNNWALDKKTNETFSRVYPEQRYQLAGYQNAWEEERGIGDIMGRYLLSIDKETGKFKEHFLDEDPRAYKKDRDCFLAALTLKKRDKELSK